MLPQRGQVAWQNLTLRTAFSITAGPLDDLAGFVQAQPGDRFIEGLGLVQTLKKGGVGCAKQVADQGRITADLPSGETDLARVLELCLNDGDSCAPGAELSPEFESEHAMERDTHDGR